ncbi:MAG: rhomboid family intramembrane serine protease [Cellulosilyticaceae bacterium]
MDFLDKLERKFGRFAIPNLITYIILGNAIAYVLAMMNPGLLNLFTFNWNAILHGQIWRLITFIFIPQSFDLFVLIISCMLYYSVGNALEQTWGSFKFNMYYLIGIIGTIIVSILFRQFATVHYINLSLFLGFATLYPDLEFMIYFIIPVKAKYMAIVYLAVLGYSVLTGGFGSFVLILISLLNYLLFFGLPSLKRARGSSGQQQFRKAQRKNIPKGTKDPIKVAFHKCTVCGKTEVDHPELEFRYCSQCNGHYEYCMEHLKNHEHIQ